MSVFPYVYVSFGALETFESKGPIRPGSVCGFYEKSTVFCGKLVVEGALYRLGVAWDSRTLIVAIQNHLMRVEVKPL